MDEPLGKLLPVVMIASGLLFGAFSGISHAGKLPKGFSIDPNNGTVKPSTSGGITTFHIVNEGCSKADYGDGRGESDCSNGNVRSAVEYKPNARVGSTIEYSFDIWVDPKLAYGGFFNPHSNGYLENMHDSRLRLAIWEGQDLLHNFLYILKVDSITGITFADKQCQPTERLGEWVTFKMQIFWTSKKNGWLKVFCDGMAIYEMQNTATDQNPHCYITNQCEPGKEKHPKRVRFTLGVGMFGFGPEWKQYGMPSQFTRIQSSGITVKIRNASVKSLQ